MVTAQTKIASHIPSSYTVDLKQLADKKARKGKTKAEKQKLKEQARAFKKEKRLNGKLYRLKLDSLQRVKAVINDSTAKREMLNKLKNKGVEVAESEQLSKYDREGHMSSLKTKSKEIKEKYTGLKRDSLGMNTVLHEGQQYIDNDELNKYLSQASQLKLDSVNARELVEKGAGLINNEEVQKYSAELSQVNLDSGLQEPPSFVMEALGEEFAELDKMKALETRIKSMPQMLNQQKPEVGAMKGQDFMKELQLKEKLGESFDPKYVDVFEEHSDKLEEAKKVVKSKKLKSGWKEVINGLFDQDMDEIKRETFKERLYIAGFIQVNSFQPFSFDANPSIGYHFTDRITAGIGGRYRVKEEDDNSENTYSYQTFFDYRISYAFYIHSEYERFSQKRPEIGRQWVNNYFLGLGHDINYRNYLKATLLLLYNFSSEFNNQDFRERISVRFGFKLN
ncbi:MAG: hypothetical protein AAF149_15405 [Bacteroidota bacterium]